MIKVRVLLRRWLSLQERYFLGRGQGSAGSARTETIHACSLGTDCVLAARP